MNLVERNAAPNGCALVNPDYVGKHNAFDLIALATEIQNADVAVNQHSGKLTLILDQVNWKNAIIKILFSILKGKFHHLFPCLCVDSFPAITSPSNTS